MNPTIAISVLLGSIFLLLAAYYVKQGMEQAALRRSIQISQHQTQIRQFNQMLSKIPSQYLTSELHTLLLEEIRSQLYKISALSPGDNNIHGKIKATEKILENLATGQKEATKSSAIQTTDEFNAIKESITAIQKLIQTRYQNQRLEKKHALGLSKQLKKIIALSAHEMLTTKAAQAAAQKKYQVAIQFYLQAKQGLTESSGIKEFVSYQQEIDKEIGLLNEHLNALKSDQDVANDGQSLSDAMDQLTEKEEKTWKKNYF